MKMYSISDNENGLINFLEIFDPHNDNKWLGSRMFQGRNKFINKMIEICFPIIYSEGVGSNDYVTSITNIKIIGFKDTEIKNPEGNQNDIKREIIYLDENNNKKIMNSDDIFPLLVKYNTDNGTDYTNKNVYVKIYEPEKKLDVVKTNIVATPLEANPQEHSINNNSINNNSINENPSVIKQIYNKTIAKFKWKKTSDENTSNGGKKNNKRTVKNTARKGKKKHRKTKCARS